MKDLRHLPTSSTIEDRGDKSIGKTIEKATPSTQNVDAATIERNPKVDAQLVSDFYRLVDASKRDYPRCARRELPFVASTRIK